MADTPQIVNRRKAKEDKRKYMRLVPPDQVKTTKQVGRRGTDARAHEQRHEAVRNAQNEDNPLLQPLHEDDDAPTSRSR